MSKTEKNVKTDKDLQPDQTPQPAEEQNQAAEKGSSKDESVEVQQQAQQIEDLKEQVEALQAENSELKNQYLRKQADFENFRKRMQREKQESIKYANSNLLQDLITIIDDFERAIRSSEESRDFDSFHSGIKMIEHQFVNMLERKYGLTRMESEGKEFDPQMHEAINMEESPDVEVQTVTEDYQKGYLLNDRVLRHAKVKVAVPAPNGAPGGTPDESQTGVSEENADGQKAAQNGRGEDDTEQNATE